jgi:hypothetical protein
MSGTRRGMIPAMWPDRLAVERRTTQRNEIRV